MNPRHGFAPGDVSRVSVAVTCDDCGTPLPGRFHVRRRHATFMGESAGGLDRIVCDACSLQRGYKFLDLIACMCERCGRPFTVAGYYARPRRYCTRQCRESARAPHDRTADRIPRDCATCGEPFTPPRSDGRYCSPACRQRAYRERQATP